MQFIKEDYAAKIKKSKIILLASYILALLLLLVWSLFAYLTMQELIASQKSYSSLINTSGKQRMLSQHSALYAVLYTKESNAQYLAEIKKSVGELKANHKFVSQYILTIDTIKYYFSSVDALDTQLNNYCDILEDFVHSPSEEKSRYIHEYSQKLLITLDKGVSVLEEESRKSIDSLLNQELLIFIGTLITLFLEAVLIVIPVFKSTEKDFELLKKGIEEKTKELILYSQVFKHAIEGIAITDKKQKILSVNKAFEKITGYGKEEAVGKTPAILKSGKHDKDFYKKMWDHILLDGHWSGEIINKKKDGRLFYEWISIIKVNDDNGKPLYYISIFSDMTPFHETKKNLEYMATHDFLTGLPNRNLFNDRFHHSIAKAKRDDTKVGLVFIDLDDFKKVNDSLGHNLGDELLIAIAARIKSETRESDTLARVGGDEFLLLVEDLGSTNTLIALVEKIRNIIIEPIYIGEKEVVIGCSIGISVYPDDSQDPVQLMQFADMAMYKAKSNEKGHYCFFTEDLNKKASKRLEVEGKIREAIKNDEFILYYQPKIDLKNNSIYGVEALIRWKKGDKIIPPAEFIEIAEESGQIIEIGDIVMQKAFSTFSRWKSMGFHTDMSINFSAKQFAQINMYEKFTNSLNAHLQDANGIIIELTESSLVTDFSNTLKILQAIKSHGAKISVDDFGTGYSSLSYLKKLPLDYLKIDRSFVMDIEQDDDDKVIVEAIASLGKKLGLTLVAEGIENEFQDRFLKSIGCDIGQGYMYSRPICEEELLEKYYK